MKIILATASPYRREVFKTLNIPFTAEASNVDESLLLRDNPETLVLELAKLKAEVIAKNHPKTVVIGFDSIGFFEGKVLEKPKTKEEAFKRLQALSFKTHQHYTGIYMINTLTEKTLSRISKNDIIMRDYSDKEIEKYLEQDSLFNTFALGYDTEKNISSSFIKEIKGNHLNLKGIPTCDIVEMLEEIKNTSC